MTNADVAASSKSQARPRTDVPGPLRQALASSGPFLGLLVSICVGWELIKFVCGPAVSIGSSTWLPPFPQRFATDLNMPHLWDIVGAFLSPARRAGPPLATVLVGASAFTFREALLGFALATVIGLPLGILLARYRLLDRAITPYVIASQTVPIIAVAPMVVIWLNAGWLSVAVIAAYLAVFPVTIATLRGFLAVDARLHELLTSFAVSDRQRLTKLELPASVPQILSGLKLAATVSIIGSIVGELPSGISDGLGGVILNYNQYYSTAPSRLWAAIVAAALTGLVGFALVSGAEWSLTRRHHERRPDDEP